MLSARNRMRRSTEFDATVKYGMRAAQPDIVVYVRRATNQDVQAGNDAAGPRVGLIVAKTVGSAVDRHRVARRLRHAARTIVASLDEADQVVIRASPGSRKASSASLEQQLRSGLQRAFALAGSDR